MDRADDSQESQDAVADCNTVDPTSSSRPVEPTNPSQQLADDTLEYQLNQIYDSLPEHPLPPVPVPQILGAPVRVKNTPKLCEDPPAAQANPVPTPCRAEKPPPETAKKVDAPLRTLRVHEATNGMMFNIRFYFVHIINHIRDHIYGKITGETCISGIAFRSYTGK